MCVRHYLLLIFIAFIWGGCSVEPARRILVIHSYEDSYAAYPDFNKLIAKEFKKQDVKAEIRTFYLNCEKYEEQPEIARMSHLLDSLGTWKPEIILVNEDQATYSLLKTYHPLLKTIPIVFAGVNYPNWELINEYPNVTGFHDKVDLLTNVQVISEFAGRVPRIFTILDATFLDRKIKSDLRTQLAGTNVYLCTDSISLQEENDKIAKGFLLFKMLAIRSRQNGAGFLWNLSKFGSTPYMQLKRDYTTINVCAIASNLCFSAINETFGYGENILAGYMTTMPMQVEDEVGAAVKILHGKKPQDMPVAESCKAYVADWKMIQEKGISKEHIPSKYEIVNMPFQEKYPVIAFLCLLVGGILLSILFGWLIFLYRREAARKRQVLNELDSEREALALAIQGGNTYAWNLNNGFLEIENSFWESLDKTPKALTPGEAAGFVHPDFRKIFEIHRLNLRFTGKHTVELLCNFSGKRYEWWEFRYSTMDGLNGVLKTAGLMMNIEDYKQREKELIEARELAEKAELKQSFLANMSHEIRTPLNAIVGFSNILTSTTNLEEEERRQYIDIINTNSELLLKLINDILELSRIESGYMSFKYEKCAVDDLINEVYTTHRVLIPIRLQFIKEGENQNLYVNIDHGRLTQVLTNFLNNAGKFTQDGYIKLGYFYKVEDHEVHIYVEDSGKGISKMEQKMIFNRFYKQDEFAQGTGLGLSICKVIIERLNGRIELWSEVGKGSRFTVILPCNS